MERLQQHQIIGFLSLFFGCLLNQWLLAWLFDIPINNVASTTKVFIFLGQLFLLGIGFAVLKIGKTREGKK